MDDAVLTWEIDRWGDLLVTKADETGSSMLRLGPLGSVVGSLADFLKIAEGARGTRQVSASVGRNAKRQDGETRLGPKGEHAVPHGDEADAPTPPSNQGSVSK